MAADYARRHNLHLDTDLTFQDLGVSAWKGKNAEAGRLADFLEAVREGLIPKGSVLLVEQLDRISRLTPRKALDVLGDIVDAGITVVTLNDERAYTTDTLETTDLLIAILMFMRANEESSTKSRRLKASWSAKRAKLGERRMTSKAPAWLAIDPESDSFVPIPERADVVQRIFEMTLEGQGQHKITEAFNRESIPTFGRAQHWQRSYIAKILKSPTVIGTLTPQTLEYEANRRVRKPLEPVLAYYPAVVSNELWSDVQAILGGTRAAPRGRHPSGGVRNLLAGLGTCHECGGTVTRADKGARSKPYLICTRAKVGAGCTYKALRYEWVEDALVSRLPERLRDLPAGAGGEAIEHQLSSLEVELDEQRELAQTIADELLSSPSETLRERLSNTEARIEDLIKAKREHLEQRERTSGPLVQKRAERLRLALCAEPLDRKEANTALRAVFKRAVVDYHAGVLELEWNHGGEDCSIPFMWPTFTATLNPNTNRR